MGEMCIHVSGNQTCQAAAVQEAAAYVLGQYKKVMCFDRRQAVLAAVQQAAMQPMLPCPGAGGAAAGLLP